MDWFSSLAEVALLICAVLFGALSMARTYLHIRSGIYVKIDESAGVAFHEGLRIGLKIPPEYQSLSDLLLEEHKRAFAVQDAYVERVARCVASLLIAFAALALAVTMLAEDSGRRLAIVELVALIFALVYFFQAERLNESWLSARAQVELLRQRIFLRSLLPGEFERGGLTAFFFRNVEEIRRHFPSGAGIETFDEKAICLWSEAKSQFQSSFMAADPIGFRLKFYYSKRVLRQRDWFENAKRRLEKEDRVKTKILFGTFASAFAFSTIDLALHVFHFGPAWLQHMLAFLILLATGASASMSALYFGQNKRSLLHQYSDCVRGLDCIAESAFMDVAEASVEHGSDRRLEIMKQIVAFEELIFKELIDFVRISRRDRLELSA